MGKGAMGTPLIHEVKPGETLFRLSRQYRVDVKQIKNWNNLRDNMIEVGQKLIVGYQ
jgi:LysM repeat protein